MTDKEVLIARLTIFLEEHGAYEKFIHNLDLFGDPNTIDELTSYCAERGIESAIITRAFTWDRSAEGDRFWLVLHQEFRNNYDSLPTEVEQSTLWDNMWEE